MAAGDDCAYGGQEILTGVDEDENGELDDSEIQDTARVCNGAPGMDGKDGVNGVNGEDGLDGDDGVDGTNGIDGVDGVDGQDGINGVDGVDGVDGINGVDGQDGLDGEDGLDILFQVLDEDPGENCAEGGSLIIFGHDRDGDGQLATTEFESTRYLCNGREGIDGEDGTDGLDGRTSLVNIWEPGSTTCTGTARRLEWGVDDDRDGTLDSIEIDGSTDLCL